MCTLYFPINMLRIMAACMSSHLIAKKSSLYNQGWRAREMEERLHIKSIFLCVCASYYTYDARPSSWFLWSHRVCERDSSGYDDVRKKESIRDRWLDLDAVDYFFIIFNGKEKCWRHTLFSLSPYTVSVKGLDMLCPNLWLKLYYDTLGQQGYRGLNSLHLVLDLSTWIQKDICIYFIQHYFNHH